MADFAKAAFPWVAAGLALAVFFAKSNSKEKTQDNKEK
jgi:hypothetical protein